MSQVSPARRSLLPDRAARAMLRRRIGTRLLRALGFHGRTSYAQCGEDLIVRFVFDSLAIARPTYLDIGAHHPTFLSNTALFHRSGCRGVNIEPDPELFERFRRARARDVNLNVGVGAQRGVLEFFVMANRTLNTFSAEEANAYAAQGIAIRSRRPIEVTTVSEVIETHCATTPDFVSIDVEGLDLVILQSFDFARHRPIVFCVETITYSSSGEGRKLDEVTRLMERNGYMAYADTHINTIFVDRARWERRGR